MNTEELLLYKNLHLLMSQPQVYDLLVKYARMKYDIAIVGLESAEDLRTIGYYQGRVKAFKELLDLKDYAFRVMKNG